MRIAEANVLALWYLHHASGGQFAPAVVTVIRQGLQVHLHASTTDDMHRSIVIIGRDMEGAARVYEEVTLVDDDEHNMWAWNDIRLGDVIQGARATLARADEVLAAVGQGKPLPLLWRAPKGAS